MQPLFKLPWPAPLREGRLLRRYDRFLVDVMAADDDSLVTAHCANSGMMEGLVRPGARVWLLPSSNARRRLEWTWVMVESDGVMVGVDTLLPNRLARAMLDARAVPRVAGYDGVVPEFPHAPGSRVDFRLTLPGGAHDVEVKNCHLVYPDGRGYFPDSVSTRATKHLTLLTREAKRGLKATVLFVVQREDVKSVRPSDLHDPDFANAARRAKSAGVNFLALKARPTLEGVEVLGTVPVDLKPYGTARVESWREALRPCSGWVRGPRAARVVPGDDGEGAAEAS